MSEKTNNVQAPAMNEGKGRKWLWIALCAVLAIAAAVVGWYLIRFQFNDSYKQYITPPAQAAVGTDFAPLADASPAVEGFSLVAENGVLKLYANPETGEVAVHDLRSGETVYSNPPLADKDKVAKKANKGYLKSQVMVDYYNANLSTGSYASFPDCVDYGELEAQSIPDGVRFIYNLGEKKTVYYVPQMLSDERYQELYEQVGASEKRLMYGQANSFYGPGEDGYWRMTENGAKMPIKSLDKLSKAFVNLGMTEEEYYAWQEMAGVEIVETLGFTVVLDWTLKGDAVECSVPPELIQERGGGMIYRIQLLPYMAAAGTDETGYMVVPNGSGSLIRFNNGKQQNAVYSQYVYDMDLVDAEYTKTQTTQSVRLPLFAICRENSAVLATIESGKTFANISADVSGRNNSYNNVYASFILRGDEKLAMFGAGETADLPIVEDDFYFEALTVRYTLLPKEQASYSGVAAYYRDRLIAEGVLTPMEAGGEVPFYYDVIGGIKETAHTLGVQHLRINAMTTFDQAAQMADQLKAKGVTSQVMNFQGWMNGGYYHDVPDKVKVLRQLGGKKDLESLSAYMQDLGGQFYADVALQNVTFISKRYMVNEETSRYYGAGYAVSLGEVNPTNLRRTSGMGYRENLYNLLSPKFLPWYVEHFISATQDYDLYGISLRDLGQELHADKRRTNVINREEALMIVQAQLDALQATGRSLMISGGNEYALEGVSHVIGAPMTATEYFITDEAVPLYQMVVHGCVDYAGHAINTVVSDDPRQDLLKLVEYGASPRYIFTWESATEMKYTGMNKFYATTFSEWADDAARSYQYVAGALNPVHGAQMVQHESLTEALKRVSYSNGVVIYVNYGAEDAQAEGLTIPAKDYLVIGGVK